VYRSKEEPAGQDLRSALAQGLLLAGRRWRTRLNERLKSVGQTDARYAALAEIADASQGVAQRELSDRLGVEEPTVVRLVDALETAGWVERRPHEQDRRVKLVHVTPEAQPTLQQAQTIMNELLDETFAGMEPAELAACIRVLNELTTRLDR
jgi:MarR family transcriptional regulator for hemolysin